ncbi:MAG TPA: hypothetical protein VFW42_01540 [Fluviicoccus sp.]|nr:hypothetical protein [Fluviicoccus sp.]
MRLHPAALTLMTLMLAACGGGDDAPKKSGGTTSTAPVAHDVVIVPSLGLVQNATVTIKKLNGEVLFTGQTSAITGKANFTIPAGIDAILIEVTGGPSATYFDESVPDIPQPFPALDPDTGAAIKMRAMALVSYDNQPIAVTPFTDAAVSYAEKTLLGLSRLSVVQGNDWIESFFNIDNVLNPPALIDGRDDFKNLPLSTSLERSSTNYTLTLTALAKYASIQLGAAGNSIPMLKIMQELSKDLEDGVLDNVAATTYKYNNFPNGLKAALNAYTVVLEGQELPADLLNHMNAYTFRVNNISNASSPETAPPPDTSGGGSTGSAHRVITPNATADLISRWIGTYTGTNTYSNTPCSITVTDLGEIILRNGNTIVSNERLDGGDEDSMTKYFTADNLLTSTYFIAKSSVSATSSLVFILDGPGNVRFAEVINNNSASVTEICQIPLPESSGT